MRVAITGVSGFVGTALQKIFPDNVSINRHDDEAMIIEKLKGVEVVINLAGAPIIKKWNDAYKKVLYSSRIDTTRTLVNAINKSDIKQFISTSAVGIYPDDKVCDETTQEIASDFLGTLASAWEAEALACSKPTTILRFGVIMGANGGALSQMLLPFRLGVGGVIGDGKMMTSWIDLDDLMRIYEFVIENKLEGIFNATAPQPVSNYKFTKSLGSVLHRPTIFPLPVFVLKLIYGEASTVLTGSKEIYPRALMSAGFKFRYNDIYSSLSHILG
ncbi:MAG: TIGR01777 family oxidoreductase [Thiovulaceae bacterium]|nr:TIGR01777 family oxidoreductase [Sulfurimonadaceae bacterium]